MTTILNGLVISTISGVIMDSEVQSDGKIIVTGYASSNSIVTARFNTNGSLDETFGYHGVAYKTFGGAASGYGLSIDNVGSIFVSGFKSDYTFGPVSFVTLKYNTNGLPDTSFNGTGIVSTNFGSESYAYDVSVNGIGELIVAGKSDKGISVAKYQTNGNLDTAFDSDGKVETTTYGSAGSSIKWLSDGKFLVAGWTYTNEAVFALVKYNSNGTLDTTFDGDGVVATGFNNGYAYGSEIVVQSDGKYVVVGGGDGIVIARYNTDGSLDTSFDGDGKVITKISGSSGAECIALQADGKLVVGGYMNSYPLGQDFVLARYNPDGSLDNTFSGDGMLTTDFGSNLDACFSIIVQTDGKVVATGRANNALGDNSYFALARYNDNGTLDTTFNSQTPSNQPLVGNDTDQSFPTSVGDDTIDGGAGLDKVIFTLRKIDYLVTKTDKGYLIKANSGNDGTDTLTNIERLQFADKKIALDLAPDGNAGQAMEFIGVIAPALLDSAPIRGLIISLFDQGNTMEGLCQQALDIDLVTKASNADLANAVFHNVTGSTANQEMTNSLVGYIESHSQANFLATVAGMHINVDLVGLQQTGIEYIL